MTVLALHHVQLAMPQGGEDGFKPALKAHPALLVDDLDQLVEDLALAGMELRPDEPLLGFARTYVADPFGNRMELMQRLDKGGAARHAS